MMMRKTLRGGIQAFAATTIISAGLSAQSPPPPPPHLIATCATGLSGGGPGCPLDRRLLIEVRRHGAGAPGQVEQAVHEGASIAEVFRLSPDQATAADSTLYAIIDVQRDSAGQYRIEQSISGSLAKHTQNCQSYLTGSADDLTFGAFMAVVSAHLARCAHQARLSIAKAN
jgi:hypothetical protein